MSATDRVDKAGHGAVSRQRSSCEWHSMKTAADWYDGRQIGHCGQVVKFGRTAGTRRSADVGESATSSAGLSSRPPGHFRRKRRLSRLYNAADYRRQCHQISAQNKIRSSYSSAHAEATRPCNIPENTAGWGWIAVLAIAAVGVTLALAGRLANRL